MVGLKGMRRFVPRSTLMRGIVKLSSGTALAQLVSLLAYPLITRIYSDNGFGILAAYVAMVNLVSTASRLKYDAAIPLPSSDQKSFSIVILSLYLNLLGAGIFLGTVLLIPSVRSWLTSEDLPSLVFWLVALGIVLTGAYRALTMWAIRFRNYGTVSKTTVTRSLGTATTQLGFGMMGLQPLGLVLGQLAGSSMGITALLRRSMAGRAIEYPTFREVSRVLREYWRFAVLGGPATVFNTLAGNMPTLLLTGFYSISVAGQFGLAMRVIGVPLELLGASIDNAFYGEIANLGRDKPAKIQGLVTRLTTRLIAVALIPTLALVFFAPALFTLVFGPEWEQAGLFARYLSIFLFFNLVSVPFTSIYMVFEKMGLYMAMSALKAVAATLSVIVPHMMSFTPTTALLIYSLAMGGFYLLFGVVARLIVFRAVRQTSNCEE